MRPNFQPNDSVTTDMIVKIIKEEVVARKKVAQAADRFLELEADRTTTTAEDESLAAQHHAHFHKHAKKYFQMYLPDAGFEVASTSRYAAVSSKAEACILATRNWTAGEIIQRLQGTLAPMTREEELAHAASSRDFSILHSSRLKAMCLLLGPARFVNHDCKPNAAFVTQNQTLTIKAIRDIRIGEEIVVKYAEDYFGIGNCECLCQTCENTGRGAYAKKSDDASEEIPELTNSLNNRENRRRLRAQKSILQAVQANASAQMPTPTSSATVSAAEVASDVETRSRRSASPANVSQVPPPISSDPSSKKQAQAQPLDAQALEEVPAARVSIASLLVSEEVQGAIPEDDDDDKLTEVSDSFFDDEGGELRLDRLVEQRPELDRYMGDSDVVVVPDECPCVVCGTVYAPTSKERSEFTGQCQRCDRHSKLYGYSWPRRQVSKRKADELLPNGNDDACGEGIKMGYWNSGREREEQQNDAEDWVAYTHWCRKCSEGFWDKKSALKCERDHERAKKQRKVEKDHSPGLVDVFNKSHPQGGDEEFEGDEGKTADQPHQCQLCKKWFANRWGRNRHLHTHSKPPPVSRGYTYKEAYNAMADVTIGEDGRWHCPKCDNDYSRRDGLAKHYTNAHQAEQDAEQETAREASPPASAAETTTAPASEVAASPEQRRPSITAAASPYAPAPKVKPETAHLYKMANAALGEATDMNGRPTCPHCTSEFSSRSNLIRHYVNVHLKKDGSLHMTKAESDALNGTEAGVETIKCPCGTTEPGFMIQCDGCSVWQHAKCLGIKKNAVPDDYVCKYCGGPDYAASGPGAVSVSSPVPSPAAAPTPKVERQPIEETPETDISRRRSGRRRTLAEMAAKANAAATPTPDKKKGRGGGIWGGNWVWGDPILPKLQANGQADGQSAQSGVAPETPAVAEASAEAPIAVQEAAASVPAQVGKIDGLVQTAVDAGAHVNDMVMDGYDDASPAENNQDVIMKDAPVEAAQDCAPATLVQSTTDASVAHDNIDAAVQHVIATDPRPDRPAEPPVQMVRRVAQELTSASPALPSHPPASFAAAITSPMPSVNAPSFGTPKDAGMETVPAMPTAVSPMPYAAPTPIMRVPSVPLVTSPMVPAYVAPAPVAVSPLRHPIGLATGVAPPAVVDTGFALDPVVDATDALLQLAAVCEVHQSGVVASIPEGATLEIVREDEYGQVVEPAPYGQAGCSNGVAIPRPPVYMQENVPMEDVSFVGMQAPKGTSLGAKTNSANGWYKKDSFRI
ncbi:histone lysine methyltransferase Set9 [Saitoella coloradoensis]